MKRKVYFPVHDEESALLLGEMREVRCPDGKDLELINGRAANLVQECE